MSEYGLRQQDYETIKALKQELSDLRAENARQAERIAELEAEAEALSNIESPLGNFKTAWKTASAENHTFRQQLATQAAVIEMAKTTLEEVQSLIEESRGVYGLHLNGDESPWNELEQGGLFERLGALPDALAAINALPEGVIRVTFRPTENIQPVEFAK